MDASCPDGRAHRSAARSGREGIWRGTLLRRRKDGTTFPAACTVVGAARLRRARDALRRRRARHHRRAEAARSARAQRAAVGDRRAGRRRRARDQQPAADDRRLGRADDGGAARRGGNRRDLELVRREAARAGQIVRNLLSFVRRSAPDRAAADLNQIVAPTVELREYPPRAAQHHARRASYAPSCCWRSWSTAKRFSSRPQPAAERGAGDRRAVDRAGHDPSLRPARAMATITRSRCSTMALGSARSCAAASSSRSSRPRRSARARGSACRSRTASRRARRRARAVGSKRRRRVLPPEPSNATNRRSGRRVGSRRTPGRDSRARGRRRECRSASCSRAFWSAGIRRGGSRHQRSRDRAGPERRAESRHLRREHARTERLRAVSPAVGCATVTGSRISCSSAPTAPPRTRSPQMSRTSRCFASRSRRRTSTP